MVLDILTALFLYKLIPYSILIIIIAVILWKLKF